MNKLFMILFLLSLSLSPNGYFHRSMKLMFINFLSVLFSLTFFFSQLYWSFTLTYYFFLLSPITLSLSFYTNGWKWIFFIFQIRCSIYTRFQYQNLQPLEKFTMFLLFGAIKMNARKKKATKICVCIYIYCFWTYTKKNNSNRNKNKKDDYLFGRLKFLTIHIDLNP